MVFEIALLAVAFLASLRVVYRHLQTQQDPDWEARWNQIPQLQREHIASAVRRGTPLGDPDEAELAAGLARQQHSSAALFSRAGIVHLLLASTLLLTALMDPSPLILAPILLLLGFLIWVAYRERITKRNLARTEAAAPRT